MPADILLLQMWMEKQWLAALSFWLNDVAANWVLLFIPKRMHQLHPLARGFLKKKTKLGECNTGSGAEYGLCCCSDWSVSFFIFVRNPDPQCNTNKKKKKSGSYLMLVRVHLTGTCEPWAGQVRYKGHGIKLSERSPRWQVQALCDCLIVNGCR